MRAWLVAYRKRYGFSQKALAKEVGISQPSYCTIENGKTNPTPKTAQKIADVLGFDWTVFFNGKGA